MAPVVGALSLTQCGTPSSIDPQPPEVAPDVTIAQTTPVSIISVPMGISLEPLVRLVERAVPVRAGDLEVFHETADSGRATIAFALERAPFRASFVDDVARLSTTVLYRARVRYDLPALPDMESSCGIGEERPPALTVAIESPLSLDPDWSLRARARISELAPATPDEVDRCEITVLGIDITDRLMEEARAFLRTHLAAIDSLVAAVDARDRFAEWWSILLQPVELGDSLWLMMGPEAIRRGPIRGAGDRVTVDLALESRPRIVFGARPVPRISPLPALDSGAVRSRLDLLVDARAEYDAASRFLSEQIRGRTIDMNGRRVHVDSISVYGIGSGLLAMEVQVSGDLGGRLYLTGRPTIDVSSGRVSVPDLDLDVATRDVLASAFSWVIVPALRQYLRERATWPTDSAVAFLETWLERGLNRMISDDLGVTGVVDSVRIVSATALRDALHVHVAAHGSATMFVPN